MWANGVLKWGCSCVVWTTPVWRFTGGVLHKEGTARGWGSQAILVIPTIGFSGNLRAAHLGARGTIWGQ